MMGLRAKNPWLGRGVWNTLDHLITRFADAGLSVVLLWVLAPAIFSRIALAQSWVAPALLVFICPESTMFRDFSIWRKEGRVSLARRLSDIRMFGWFKLGVAIMLSAWVGQLSELPVPAMIWAFALAIAPQVVAADREYLRLELRLRELNLLSLFQKATLLGGTIAVANQLDDSFWPLASVALGSLGTTAALAYWRARVALRSVPTTSLPAPKHGKTLWESIRDYSTWYHVQGVLTLWVYTMDLWALGIAGIPARTLGLYAVALKVANFAMTIPQALTNLFTVWLGRQSNEPDVRARENRLVWPISGLMGLFSLLQWAGLIWLGPWLLSILARGRWTPDELATVNGWMQWMLVGGVLLNFSLPVSQWLLLRLPIGKVLMQVGIPWATAALAVYLMAAFLGGPAWTSRANCGVALILVILVVSFRRRALKRL